MQILTMAAHTKGFVVGATRLGNHNVTRHCPSAAPFDANLFPWHTPKSPGTTEDFFFLLIEEKGSGLKVRYHRAGAYVMCEE